ncbi:hypothetical protein [Leptolyngbya iicbica]|nr:hypothetical protein [Leptolyngbya sp. LK]
MNAPAAVGLKVRDPTGCKVLGDRGLGLRQSASEEQWSASV